MAKLEQRPEINDLSLLSLLAAHELERLQRSEPAEGQYLSALRDSLAEQISASPVADIRTIAPSTVQLYRRALLAATNDDPQDFAALRNAVNGILDQLTRVSTATRATLDPRDLTQLHAFIIALHSQLLAEKQRAHASRSARHFRV